MDNLIGKKLDSRYEIQELIGIGDMSIVYKAFDKTDNKIVAIKVFKDSSIIDSNFIKFFCSENKKVWNLPNDIKEGIVEVYNWAFGHDAGLGITGKYTVMEYVYSITLKEFIQRNAPISWNEALYLVSNGTIFALPNENFIHRDLKPQRVLLMVNGITKLSGIGIDYTTAHSAQRPIIESDYYRSPESYKGDIDFRSNVFSFGVILYEALTGELPFKGDSSKTLYSEIVHSAIKRPTAFNSDIPKGVEQICEKALQKNPEKRYQNTNDLLEDVCCITKNHNAVFDHPNLDRVWDYENDSKFASNFFRKQLTKPQTLQQSEISENAIGSKTKNYKIEDEKIKMTVDENIYSEINENKFGDIVCPYCFKTFKHSRVEFRSEEYFNNEEEIEEFLGKSFSDMQIKGDKVGINTYNKYRHLLKGQHKEYTNFWSKHSNGMTTEIDSRRRSIEDIPAWELPIIDETLIEKFITDSDGFVTGCVEKIKHTETSARVCPHCRNPLPKGYGKFEVKRIAIIGVTGSGKTVYISQLLKNMGGIKGFMNKVGLATFPTTINEKLFISKNAVEMGIKLPVGTIPETLVQPMFFDVADYKDGKTKYHTIVLYDIAGENCQDIVHEDGTITSAANSMQKFGGFVTNADGLILLIDPRQMDMVENSKKVPEADEVVKTLHNVLEKGNDNRSQIPIAICFAKSDEAPAIQQLTNNLSNNQVNYCDEGFDAKSYNQLEEKLAIMMRQYSLHTALKTQFKYFNYFAISAIGCDVDKNTNAPTTIPNPKRIEEPIFWLFKHFGFIKYNSKTLRPFEETKTVKEIVEEGKLFKRKKEIVKEIKIKFEEDM